MGEPVTAKRIEERRKFLGLSQSELARRIGVKRGHLWNWETFGSVPKADTLVALATTLETTIDYLLGKTDNPDLSTGTSGQLSLVEQPSPQSDLAHNLQRFEFLLNRLQAMLPALAETVPPAMEQEASDIADRRTPQRKRRKTS